MTGWSRRFDAPVVTTDGLTLVTLEDAARHIMNLPNSERDLAHWQVAGEMLIAVAEGRGPLMFAHIGMMKAINHGKTFAKPRRRRARRYAIVR